MKKIIFFLTLLISTVTLGSSRKVVIGEDYHFTYSFRDLKMAHQELKWSFNKNRIDNYIYGFGLVEQNSARIKATQRELRDALMYVENGILAFDYSKVVIDSREMVKPLYVDYMRIVNKYNLNKRDQVELVMRFLQDIPYKMPPKNYLGRFIAGLFPPSELMKMGWGDCDSKSILMAAILSHDEFFYNKMAMINVPGHALLGIVAHPLTYDKYIEFQGEHYVYSEPVGPARTPFGQTNSPYSHGIEVHPLVFSRPSPIKLNQAGTNSNASGITSCPDGGFKATYKRPFAPERVESCTVNNNGKYVKHGPTITYSTDSGEVIKKELFNMGSKFQ